METSRVTRSSNRPPRQAQSPQPPRRENNSNNNHSNDDDDDDDENRPTSWTEYEQLDAYRYSKVDWLGIMDLRKFVSSCTWRECKVEKISNRPCPFRCRGCKAGTKRLIVQAEYRQAEEAREEAKALNDRAEEENPGLYQQDKLWLPHSPGIALIRGDLVADIANFFSDCDISVHVHNEPAFTRSLNMKGADIVWASENNREVRHYFMRWSVQVRVQIVKFHPPSDEMDREHPFQGVLCGMQGAHGAAMCKIITFLGSTGELERENVDNDSSYWFYSASGLKDNFMENIGKPSFRMVRVRKSPRPGIYEMMLRFGLERGKERAKHFADNCGQNVREWKPRPISFKDIHGSSVEDVFVEPSEDDESRAPDLEDPSEDSDVGNLSDISGSTDRSGMPLTLQEKAAIERRRAERRRQTLAEVQDALQRRRAAEAAAEEELPRFYCPIHRELETKEEHSRRIAQYHAAIRERRLAYEADWEQAQAQAARERRAAEALEVADESQAESGETTRGVRGDSEDGESRLESLDTMDVEEEEDAEDEPRRGITHLAPEYLRQGGKIRPGTAPFIVLADRASSNEP